MADSYYMIEPLGYQSRDSKLERCWMSFSGRYGLHTERILRFDPYASMSRQPIKYILKAFNITDDLPEQQWVLDALENFIRDEIIITNEEQPDPCFPIVEKNMYLSDDFLKQFLYQSEWENYFTVELPKDDSNYEMANSIYKLLCNPKICSSKNSKNNNREKFIQEILPLIESKKRISFILPGFPFKDQNKFRVPFSASNVDFGEIVFLIRLHNLIQTMYQVHPFGAEVIIVSDGRLYQDIFHISSEEVEEYQRRLIHYRNELNIQGDVSIIDLKDMIDRADMDGKITTIINHISDIIKSKFVNESFFQKLIQGMKWNMNSSCLLKEYNDSDVWDIIKKSKSDIKENLIDAWGKYHCLAETAAIKYASMNLMLRWTGLLQKFFPESIRCTVHPKKGQFGLTTNYAWNGVAWSEKWPKSIHDISVVPYYTLQKFGSIKKVSFKNNNHPCFYTKENYNRTLDCAKKVLKSDGWNIDNLFGREFNEYDLNEFVNLGKGDPNFSWERRRMSEEYYTTLLKFRINHYKKYGFGVHAIFMDGKLIGQMGLQVLNEPDEIEFVIFLGKDYVNNGIGTKLLRYLFQRCREEGIKKVFGVIRNGNKIAETTLKKFNVKKLKTVAHYHQSGILYEIKL